MSGTASNGNGVWKWARDLLFIGSVIGSIAIAGQSVVRALDWIYVDLGKNREAINALVTSNAETRVTVDSHTKTLENIDRKIDRILFPPPGQSPPK